MLRGIVLTLAALALPACHSDPAIGPSSPDFVMRSPSNAAIGVDGTPTFIWDSSIGTASYTLQVSTDSDFSTFLVNQAGITGTALNPPIALAPGTVFFWRVIAERPTGNINAEGSPWSFATVAPIPGAFTMTSPPNGTFNESPRPSFSWTSSPGTASFRLQVSTDSGFGSPTVDQSGLSTTSLTLSAPLASSTLYFWRVLAESRSTTLASGAPWSFTTQAGTPLSFSLVSPLDTATLVPTLPTYQWNPSAGAISYRLQVSTDSFFTNLVVDQTGITTTSFKPVLMLLPFTTYTWRVYAISGSATTLGTPASFSFTTD